MLPFPNIDPVAFSIGPLSVRWYGLMYLISFMIALVLLHKRGKARFHDWSFDTSVDLITYLAFGVILGGRLGYILFYDFAAYLAEPSRMLKIWQGGMSFHGGLIGVVVAAYLFSRKIKFPLLLLFDHIAPVVPIGLFLGRIGNFINGELWGRISDVPWAVVFPAAGPEPRHPSQLYEAGLEGLLLFVFLNLYARRPRPLGQVSGLFLIGYALARSFAELYREPDAHIGFLSFGLTMGQALCIPLGLLGVVLYAMSKRVPVKRGGDAAVS